MRKAVIAYLLSISSSFKDISLLIGIASGIIGLIAYSNASAKKEFAAKAHFDKISVALHEIDKRLISIEHSILDSQRIEAETKFAIEKLTLFNNGEKKP